jgi:general secretion pathway protein K
MTVVGARDRGSVLIASLWLVAVAAMLGMAIIALARAPQHLAKHEAESLKGRLALEKAYAAGVSTLLNRAWSGRLDGTEHAVSVDGGSLQVSVQDEAGKFDVNAATGEGIGQILGVSRVSEARRNAIAAAILDWRDGDADRNLNGAEAADYAARGLPYGPRNRPFQSVTELQRVLGLSADVYRALEPLVTVHTQRSGPDARFAPAPVLRVLPGMDEPGIQTILRERASFTATARPGDGSDSVLGRSFTIRIKSPGSDGPVLVVGVRLIGLVSSPVRIFAWHLAG